VAWASGGGDCWPAAGNHGGRSSRWQAAAAAAAMGSARLVWFYTCYEIRIYRNLSSFAPVRKSVLYTQKIYCQSQTIFF
jgi:hypothetical protein